MVSEVTKEYATLLADELTPVMEDLQYWFTSRDIKPFKAAIVCALMQAYVADTIVAPEHRQMIEDLFRYFIELHPFEKHHGQRH